MADPAASTMTVDLTSLLMGGGGTATTSALVGYFLSQWRQQKNGNGNLKGLEQALADYEAGLPAMVAEWARAA